MLSKYKERLSVKAHKLFSPSDRKSSSTQTLQSTAGPSQSQSLTSGASSQHSASAQSLATPNKSFVPDPALKDAIEKFAADLSESDKAAFQSAENIMDKMLAIDKANAESSLSRSFGTRIGNVLQLIQRFVGSVATCIQYNPEISSLVIGGFNCVLSIVLGYIEFFESLTAMMERIGGHLDYLSKFGSRVFQSSPDVQKVWMPRHRMNQTRRVALVNAYGDLLGFFVAVRGVFVGGGSNYLKSFKLFLRLSWEPFESRFNPIQDRFFDHTLIVVRSAGVQDLIMRYEKEQQENLGRRVEKRRQVLAWLSSIDYEETHQRHIKKHHKGTGQWLLDHPDSATWRDTLESTLLWCHGMPGTGKTVLTSLVVEKLSAQYELSKDTGIAFVYCNYKEPQEATTYVKAFIKQLSRRMDELPVELEEFYDKHYFNDSKPGCIELQDVLMRISKRFEKVFLVLDALDECADDQRRELFKVLCGIILPEKTNHGNIKLFVTSRKEQDIQRAFESFPIIEIEAKKVNEDIESYVKAQIDNYLRAGELHITDTLRRKILTTLGGRAGGMFLWIEFQLKHILSQTSDHGIEKALGSLPEDMEQTYERIIHLICEKPEPQRNLARRVLMWIAYAERPLLLGELVCAVAMENDTRSATELKSMVPTAETLVSVCANLIVLDGEGWECTARFVHFSVQEFLLKNRSAIEALNIKPKTTHAEMARLCITFLLSCGSECEPKSYGNLCYPSLISYAESAWYGHVRALTEIGEDLMLLILEFFEFGAFLMDARGRVIIEGLRYLIYKRLSHTKFSPSTVALIFGLPLVFEYLAKGKHDQRHYPDDMYAMHHAARYNSCEAVKRLCDRGFRIDEPDDKSCQPLYYAASREVAQLILGRGADVNARGGEYGNALQAAAFRGTKEVVQLLLDRGADVKVQGGQFGNALQAAVLQGTKEVVQLLLDRGADVKVQGGYYGNALQAAVLQGTKEVVQLLLDRGADVKVQGGYYGNALQAAVLQGTKEVVQLLLDRGADVKVQGGYYGNALQAAAFRGTKEVVQLLLDRGADVKVQGGYYGNALQAATIYGRKEVVQLLLDRGADVKVQGGCYGNALQAAAYQGTKEVVQLLLDSGADVNAQGGYHGNALQAAVYSGRKEVTQLLLDNGAIEQHVDTGYPD